jgi:hypothetical protein
MSWGVDPNLALSGVCHVRLSLSAGEALPATDGAGNVVFAHPFRGNAVALYTSGRWRLYRLSGPKNAAVPAITSRPFDVFLFDNNGTLALEMVNWANDASRVTALTLLDGVYVKSGQPTRRYLGTGRTTLTPGQCEDSVTKRFLWNVCGSLPTVLSRKDSTSHSYQGTSRFWNNDPAQQLEWISGLRESVRVELTAQCRAASAGQRVTVSAFLDGGQIPQGGVAVHEAGGNDQRMGSSHTFPVAPGYRTVGIYEDSFAGLGGFSEYVLAVTLLHEGRA